MENVKTVFLHPLTQFASITKTGLYSFDHLYIVKLGFIGIYNIFLISAQKHRLWDPQSMF